MSQRVKDIMTPANKLIYLSASTTVEEAYQVMQTRGIHSVLVMSEGSYFGPRIFQEEDLRYVWSQNLDPKSINLGDYARPIEERADPNWTCEEVKAHFRYSQHLIVADEYGNILGIIATSDLRKCR